MRASLRTAVGVALAATVGLAAAKQPTAGPHATTVDQSGHGETFYALERHATAATVQFADATVTAERTLDGRIRTRVTDPAGADVATSILHRVSAAESTLEYRAGDHSIALPVPHRAARPTLMWAAAQSYEMRGSSDATQLRWQQGVMRRKGARAAQPTAVEMEWPDGFQTTVVRHVGKRQNVNTGKLFTGQFMHTRIRRGGTEIGRMIWYPEERVFAWAIPGVTEGYVDPERLAPIGGWPFTPDLAWAGVQAFAFDRFAAQIAAQRFVASRAPSWLERATQFWLPTLQANEQGCDNLHWLDGSVLRFCCDAHDRCYEKYGCSARTWWTFWTSWRCTVCNGGAAFCFATGGIKRYPVPSY